MAIQNVTSYKALVENLNHLGLRSEVEDRGTKVIIYYYDEEIRENKAVALIYLASEKYYPTCINADSYVAHRKKLVEAKPKRFKNRTVQDDVETLYRSIATYYLNVKKLVDDKKEQSK